MLFPYSPNEGVQTKILQPCRGPVEMSHPPRREKINQRSQNRTGEIDYLEKPNHNLQLKGQCKKDGNWTQSQRGR